VAQIEEEKMDMFKQMQDNLLRAALQNEVTVIEVSVLFWFQISYKFQYLLCVKVLI